jgi:head-tail adaptor
VTIGQRTERIAIVRRTRVQRTDGGYNTSVAIASTRWASVKPVRSKEHEIAGSLRAPVTYVLEVDSRGMDVTHDDTIVWTTRDNAVLNVREVRLPNVRSLPLTIVAESGVITPDVAALFEDGGEFLLDFSQAQNSGYLALLEDI